MALILALLGLYGLGYPSGTMNARGERILVFGDSLTQHAGSVPVWDVDQGPQRSSSGPGDLFASMLLDQGAAAVRINARSGRSALNFLASEPAAQLIANDIAWRPTKIVFVLGTNDVGLAPLADEAAFKRIVASYQPAGAEVWAIGPFMNRQDAAKQAAVVETMRRVFGKRFIDGRAISKLISPGSDGIHYDGRGARALALNMTDAILSTSPAKAWGGIAIGAAIVAGTALLWTLSQRRGRSLRGLEIVDGKRWNGSTAELVRNGYRQTSCASGLDAKGLARCWTRGAALGAAPDEREALAKVIAAYKDTARRRGYGEQAAAVGACDVATPDFIRAAAAAGVSLKAYRFDLTKPKELSKLGKLYGLDRSALAKLRREVANAGDRGCMFHEVAVTSDGTVIDWTASQFKRLPMPYVFHIDPIEAAKARQLHVEPSRAPSPPVRRLPADAAEIVSRAVQAVPDAGRFGDDRAFISDVHAQLVRQGTNISLPDFKRELLRMLRSGQVLMVRADLVGAMDPDRVAASEISDMGSEFHFITIPSPRGRAGLKGPLTHGATFKIAEAAEAVPKAERFGDRKVFIVDVHRELNRRGIDVSLPDLKRELVRMHRDQNVVLARADLVAAMDPDKVRDSEARADGATFHFVVIS